MLAPQYYLYLAVNPAGVSRPGISSNPQLEAYLLDGLGFIEIYLVQPPQPIWVAELFLAALKNVSCFHSPKHFIRWVKASIPGVPGLRLKLARYSLSELKLRDYEAPEWGEDLSGYNLLLEEIPGFIRSGGYRLGWDPETDLQYLVFHSQIRREAAVGLDLLGTPSCRRCGATTGIIADDCIYCGSRSCYICTNCQALGVSRSCQPLYFRTGARTVPDIITSAKPATVTPEIEFELTPAQTRAARALLDFLDGSGSAFLVWAVCGGGKTEVSFAAVARVLSAGGRVLFAIPRKDVVVELKPRFEKAFPGVAVTPLYGGSGDKFQDVPLTLATTHQCLRFYERFDLVILDEADAFPYQGSAMLHYAVERARKPQGKLVIMTATPDRTLLRKTRTGQLPYVTIPARPHRKPLAVPELVRAELPDRPPHQGRWTPPQFMADFMLRLRQKGRKGLIFFPTLGLIESWGPVIMRWAEGEGLRGAVTSGRKGNASAVKQDLRDGKLDFAVCSTILERGITIPNLDVLVVAADHEGIFDSRTLIQISGRAGRLGDPARVLFAGATISRPMREAVAEIRELNEEGLRLGYLDP